MGRKGDGRGRLRSVDKDSDESDEDYLVDKDEDIESEDEYVSSFAEDETEDSLCEFEEEEEFMEKKVKNVRGLNLAIQSRKRKRKTNGVVMLGKKMFSSRRKNDDDSDDSDEYDGGTRDRIRKPIKNRRGLYRRQESRIGDDSHEYCRSQRNGALKPIKKNKVSYVEEDSESHDNGDDNDDEEFIPDEVDDDIDDAGDNDDKEFLPDEVDDDIDDEDDDFVDDEDEVIDLKRNKQLGRLKKQGERISKGQKRMRYCSDLKNDGSQRPGNKRRLIKKTGHELDVEFANNEISVDQEKTKTTGRPHRRRNILISDSEYEFTISEEENEQIREANKICRNVTATLRSATPVKRLQRDQDSVHPRMKNSGKKGKEKEDGLKIETGKQVCGICLSEEGKRTVRGGLNCCSHYFCFACIMEWSKVESRCPVCKQRFSAICKSSRSDSGFATRTPVIQVPQRDQVYQPSEEELRGYLDPYDNVFCTECQEGGDDALMLLCDICDSPAHTYCVGLGYDVPEGNWYCDGCRPTAFDSLNPHGLNPIPDDRVGTSMSVVGSSPMENVRETFDLNEAYAPDTPLSNVNGQPSTRLSVGDFPASPASGSGAFTVLERRRIQLQIRQILSTRRQQDHETNDSQVVRGGALEPQLMEIPHRSTSSQVFPFHERSEAANNRPSWPNGDPFVTRLTPSHDTAIQRQTSTSNEGFYGSFLQNEFAGINARFGSIFGQQQVQLCGNKPNIESDVNASPHSCREGTVPSRRFQGNQHLPL